jgi:hypothetical protein
MILEEIMSVVSTVGTTTGHLGVGIVMKLGFSCVIFAA